MQRTQFVSYTQLTSQLSLDWYGDLSRQLTNNAQLLLTLGGSQYRVSLVQDKAVVKRVNMPKTYYDSFVEFFTHRLLEFSIYSRSVRIAHLINKVREENLEKNAYDRVDGFLSGLYHTFDYILKELNDLTRRGSLSDETIEKLINKNSEICQFKTEIQKITQKILDLEQNSPSKQQLAPQLTNNTKQLKSQLASLQSPEQQQKSGTSIQAQLAILKSLCGILINRAILLEDSLSHRPSIPVGSSKILEVFLDTDLHKA